MTILGYALSFLFDAVPRLEDLLLGLAVRLSVRGGTVLGHGVGRQIQVRSILSRLLSDLKLKFALNSLFGLLFLLIRVMVLSILYNF